MALPDNFYNETFMDMNLQESMNSLVFSILCVHVLGNDVYSNCVCVCWGGIEKMILPLLIGIPCTVHTFNI